MIHTVVPRIFSAVFIMLFIFTASVAIGEDKSQMVKAPFYGALYEDGIMKMTNKDVMMNVVKEFYYFIDNNKNDKITQIISSNFIDHDAQDIKKGLEELQNLITTLHKGFDEISHELEQIYLVEEDKIFVRWKMTGKHTGEFFNIPPSNKNIILYGHDLFKIVEGKIVEQWHIEQLLSLINQISSNN